MVKNLFPVLLLACTASLSELHGQSAATRDTPVPMAVPAPINESPSLPAPARPPIVQPRVDAALVQRLTPRVEIWRRDATRPQVSARRSDRGQSDQAFVTGTEPVTIRLQFTPQSAGEQVTVIAARGIRLDAPQQVLTVSAQGDCTFVAQLEEGALQGHLITYCKNVRTVVPLTRAPLQAVEAGETRTGGRP